MKKALMFSVVFGLGVAQFPAHAISESYRKQLEHSGCTQESQLTGCNLHKSRAWNENHGNFSHHRRHESEHRHDGKHYRDSGLRQEIEQFLDDSVIGEDVADARQALYNYGCKRLGPDHWKKEGYEIRLTSLDGRVRSGRVH